MRGEKLAIQWANNELTTQVKVSEIKAQKHMSTNALTWMKHKSINRNHGPG